MLAEGLLDSHFYNNAAQIHSPVIAGVGDAPVEMNNRHDLCSSNENILIAEQTYGNVR